MDLSLTLAKLDLKLMLERMGTSVDQIERKLAIAFGNPEEVSSNLDPKTIDDIALILVEDWENNWVKSISFPESDKTILLQQHKLVDSHGITCIVDPCPAAFMITILPQFACDFGVKTLTQVNHSTIAWSPMTKKWKLQYFKWSEKTVALEKALADGETDLIKILVAMLESSEQTKEFELLEKAIKEARIFAFSGPYRFYWGQGLMRPDKAAKEGFKESKFDSFEFNLDSAIELAKEIIKVSIPSWWDFVQMTNSRILNN